MYNTHNSARTTEQANCNSPRYYLNTKRGWRRYVPPGDEAPFAVKVRGKWHLVHRATTDSEFFAAHPDTPRLTARPIDPSDPWIYRVNITTACGDTIIYGCDNFDVSGAVSHVSGTTRRERFTAAARRMLCDPNLGQRAS